MQPQKKTLEQSFDPKMYLNTKFVHDGTTYQIWHFSPETNLYTVVSLVDTTGMVGTEQYGVLKSRNKQTAVHKLVNVNPNSHFTIPVQDIRRVINDPSILSLNSSRPKLKKIIR